MHISKYNPIITSYDKTFPVYITTIGVSDVQGSIYRPSGICDHQLLYTTEGKGKAYLYGRKYELEPGSILFLPADTTHFYERITEDWKTYWITYNGAIEFFEKKPAIWTVPKEFDFMYFYNAVLSYKNTPEWSLKSSVLLYELLVSCRELAAAEQTSAYNLRSRFDPVIDFLYEHCTENLSIDEIAGMIGVSPEHFCKLFKEYTNMRPFEYITHLRIERAKTLLLENPREPVGRIARAAGYTDNSYFIKKFKELEGLSPGQYRKMVHTGKTLFPAAQASGNLPEKHGAREPAAHFYRTKRP